MTITLSNNFWAQLWIIAIFRVGESLPFLTGALTVFVSTGLAHEEAHNVYICAAMIGMDVSHMDVSLSFSVSCSVKRLISEKEAISGYPK